ncbi:MAG: oligopeptide/dipeptide ABC transporter ATP-binding protein, partial [Pseudobdellovibrionaceae bacterium]
SVPHFESDNRMVALKTIPGLVPSLANLPKGCRFADRCFRAQPSCCDSQPDLTDKGPNGHKAACFFPLPENFKREGQA